MGEFTTQGPQNCFSIIFEASKILNLTYIHPCIVIEYQLNLFQFLDLLAPTPMFGNPIH